MTETVLKPPMHPSEQVKCFRNVRENDNHNASGTKYLQERPCSPFYAKQNHRTENQGACWNEGGHCFNQGVIHSVVSSPKGFRSGGEPSRDCYQQTSSYAERMFTATPEVVLVGWFDVPAESALSRAPEHEIRDSLNAD